MTIDDREYLLDRFNIDVDKYSNEELNNILDEIISVLDEAIEKKLNDIKQIKTLIENMNP